MTELFNENEMHLDSPRLRWMKETGVRTFKLGKVKGDEDEYGNEIPLWIAGRGYPVEAFQSKPQNVGRGDTEDDAIADWARRNGRHLWNETPLALGSGRRSNAKAAG